MIVAAAEDWADRSRGTLNWSRKPTWPEDQSDFRLPPSLRDQVPKSVSVVDCVGDVVSWVHRGSADPLGRALIPSHVAYMRRWNGLAIVNWNLSSLMHMCVIGPQCVNCKSCRSQSKLCVIYKKWKKSNDNQLSRMYEMKCTSSFACIYI